MRILVMHVDGNPVRIHELLAEANEDAEVISTKGLAAGLEELARQRPDLILVDVGRVKGRDPDYVESTVALAGNVPVVVFAEHGDDAAGETALASGAMDCIGPGELNARWLGCILRFAAERRALVEAMESRLRAAEVAEERLQTVIDSNVDGMVIVDREGKVLGANRAAAALLERPEEDLVGTTFGISVASGESTEVEILCRGGTRTVELRRQELAWEGEPASIIGLHDVSEQRAREEGARLQSVALEAAANAIALTDGEGSILKVNSAFCRLTGYEAHEVLGRNPRLLQSGVHDRAFYTDLWETVSNGRVWRGEVVNRRKDGSLYTEEQTITPVLSELGKVTHFIAIKQDVTERKAAEEALRESEARYRRLFEEMLDGFALHEIIVDDAGAPCDYRFLEVNPAFERLVGFEAGRVVGRRAKEVLPKLEPLWIETYGRVALDGGSEHFSLYSAELDKTFEVKVFSPRPGLFATLFEDISERVRVRKALEDSEARYRSLAEQAPDVIYRIRLTPSLRYEFINTACTRITGYTPEEFYADSDLVFKIVHPDDRPLLEARRRDPRLHAEPMVLRWIAKNGRTILAEQRGLAILDEAGEVVAVEGIIRDVTEKHRVDQQLQQARRLEAVGQLAGGVAHDFNNLLTVILGNAEILGETADEDELTELNEIVTAAERATALTRQLLAFSRQQVLTPETLDLNTVVAETERLLRRVIGEHIELVSVLEPALGLVLADPGQIQQVIMNLALNARDAMAEGGKLTIETENVELGLEQVEGQEGMAPGQYVRLVVSDTGVGMDQETLSQVFDPFFTTKGPEGGTGLGLATVCGIVGQSGGMILPYSEPKRGTTFKIYLPRVYSMKSRPPQMLRPPASLTRGGTETILVVEDDRSLCSLVRAALRKGGYEVLWAEDGQAALKVFEAHDGAIDLLLTDMVMPVMGGIEVAQELLRLSPRTRVLFLSGYTKHRMDEVTSLGEFIEKPFRTSALLSRIREILDSESTISDSQKQRLESRVSK